MEKGNDLCEFADFRAFCLSSRVGETIVLKCKEGILGKTKLELGAQNFVSKICQNLWLTFESGMPKNTCKSQTKN